MPTVPAFRKFLIVSVTALSLAGCGGGSVEPNKTAAPLPPVADFDNAQLTYPAAQPMPLSANDTLTPVPPAADVPAEAVPAATAVPVPLSTEERLGRLEAAVTSLRSDYDRMMPAFASLNTTNARIETLLGQLEGGGKLPPAQTTTTTVVTKTSETAPVIAAPAVPAKTAPTEADKTAAAPSPPPAPTDVPAVSKAGSNAVTAVRIGEHGSKTRLVFDLTAKAKPELKYDLDNSEKLMIVELPSTSWSGKESGKPNSPMISGWTAQGSGQGGTSIAIQLKKPARVLSTEFLKAEGADPARLVIDIAAGN